MPGKILFLEDDEDDIYITKSFFDDLKTGVDIEIVNSTSAVQQYLASNSTPSIFLMDYNSVQGDVALYIRELKSKPFKYVPVIVLRGVTDDKIVKECYSAGASSFIRKPANSDDTIKKITQMLNYWFQCVELPGK